MRLLSVLSVCAALLTAPLAHAQTVTIFTFDKNHKPSTVEVKANAQRIATSDLASLDILDNLGLGDKVVAMPKTTKVQYLMKYFNNDKITNIGSLKEVDLEKLMQAKPDIIFISGRLAGSIDRLSKIAPVVYLTLDYHTPFLKNIERNALAIAKIYGKESSVHELVASMQQRYDSIRQKANGKTAVIGLTTASNFRTLGDDGRAGIIGRELGFVNLAKEISATHGNESSFELLVKLDPEYIFVLDRDSAISRPGAKLARDLMDNELVRNTKAFKNNRIFYLNPQVWYLAEGGITAASAMLEDVEKSLEK